MYSVGSDDYRWESLHICDLGPIDLLSPHAWPCECIHALEVVTMATQANLVIPAGDCESN